MKTAAVILLISLPGCYLSAQTTAPERSVWVEDYAPDALAGAVAAGRRTLIYSGGSSMAQANHVAVARYVARRVAEELATALVLPITADAGAPLQTPDGGPPANAYETLSSTLRTGGFEYVVIIADEGRGTDDRTLEDLARRLQAEHRRTGVRVIYVTAHEIRPGQDMTLNADYLRRWGRRTVPPDRRKLIEDQAELLFVDPERVWLQPGMIAAEDRQIVVPALGRILLEQRVSGILNQIRAISPAHLR